MRGAHQLAATVVVLLVIASSSWTAVDGESTVRKGRQGHTAAMKAAKGTNSVTNEVDALALRATLLEEVEKAREELQKLQKFLNRRDEQISAARGLRDQIVAATQSAANAAKAADVKDLQYIMGNSLPPDDETGNSDRYCNNDKDIRSHQGKGATCSDYAHQTTAATDAAQAVPITMVGKPPVAVSPPPTKPHESGGPRLLPVNTLSPSIQPATATASNGPPINVATGAKRAKRSKGRRSMKSGEMDMILPGLGAAYEQSDYVEVVMTADDETFPGAAATINSILSNAPSDRLHRYRFHILTTQGRSKHFAQWVFPQLDELYLPPDQQSMQKMALFPNLNSMGLQRSIGSKDSERQRWPFSLVLEEVDMSRQPTWVVRGQEKQERPISMARIYIPSMLPDLEKYIFIEPNVIVRSDLERVWNLSLSHIKEINSLKEKDDTSNSSGDSDDDYPCYPTIAAFRNCDYGYEHIMDFSAPEVSKQMLPRRCIFETSFFVVDTEAWKATNITQNIEGWIALNRIKSVYAGGIAGPLLAAFYSSYENLGALPGLKMSFLSGLGSDKEIDPKQIDMSDIIAWSGPNVPWSGTADKGELKFWTPYALTNPDYAMYKLRSDDHERRVQETVNRRLKQAQTPIQDMNTTVDAYPSDLIGPPSRAFVLLFSLFVLLSLLCLLLYQDPSPHRYSDDQVQKIHMNMLGTRVVKRITYIELVEGDEPSSDPDNKD